MADILLIFPELFNESTGPPLNLLFLASALENAGFSCRIIDERVDPDSITNIHKEIGKDTLFIGISSLTGIQIQSTLRIASKIRDISPQLPIVLGGVHASLMPKQSIQHKLLDIVVYGEGEFTIVELAKRIKEGTSLNGVNGLCFKKNGEIVVNPPRPLSNFCDIAMPAWHHAKPYLDKYLRRRDNRLMVQFSRGCPFRCSYCYNAFYNEREYRDKDISIILDEIKFIIDNYGIRRFDLCDDNFVTHNKMVLDFCKAVRESNLDIDLQLSMRINKIKPELMDELRSAGVSKVFIGIESGSQRILRELKKDLMLKQIKEAVKTISRSGIDGLYSFMFNFPFETMDDLIETKELAEYIQNNAPGSTLWLHRYAPYPGTQLYERIISDYGFSEPETLEGWSSLSWDHSSTSMYFKVPFSEEFTSAFQLMWSLRFPQMTFTQKTSFVRLLLKKWSDFRFKNNLFYCLPEFRFINFIKGRLLSLKR